MVIRTITCLLQKQHGACVIVVLFLRKSVSPFFMIFVLSFFLAFENSEASAESDLTSNAELLFSANRLHGLANPGLALNLSAVADWSTQQPFLDLSKSMRPWIGHLPGQWGGRQYQELQDEGLLDEAGWPMRIPPELEAIGTIWDWDEDHPASEYRAGTYVLFFEGVGDIELFGDVRVIDRNGNQIVFENTSGGSFGFNILSTDPLEIGNYVRNLSIVRNDHIPLFELGALFNPDWVELISDMQVLRYMDWMETNNSSNALWSDRPQPMDATWAAEGVPVEVMVRLANETASNPWFSIPHLASDEYVRQFANFVRDNLDPELSIIIEYSNEAWNSLFEQSQWFGARGRLEWPDANEYQALLNFYAMRMTRVMEIWTDVFGEETTDRLIRVAGTQTANTWVTEQVLNAPLWAQSSASYTQPTDVLDSVAATTYFGTSLLTTTEYIEAIEFAIQEPTISAFSEMQRLLLDPAVSSSIPTVILALENQKSVASAFGLDLWAYEGGQHVFHRFGIDGSAEHLNDFLLEFVRSEEMAELYHILWDAWWDIGDGPFMQFSDVEASTIWGSWGLWSYLGDSTPRSELLEVLNRQYSTALPAPTSNRFQSGLTALGGSRDDILIGTSGIDFLSGSSGADLFVGGAGDDRIHGGSGVDVALIQGVPSDIVLTRDGIGYLVQSVGETDFVIDIEILLFESGERVLLQN